MLARHSRMSSSLYPPINPTSSRRAAPKATITSAGPNDIITAAGPTRLCCPQSCSAMSTPPPAQPPRSDPTRMPKKRAPHARTPSNDRGTWLSCECRMTTRRRIAPTSIPNHTAAMQFISSHWAGSNQPLKLPSGHTKNGFPGRANNRLIPTETSVSGPTIVNQRIGVVTSNRPVLSSGSP